MICSNYKCKNPCDGLCGINAECLVRNHKPSCICLHSYTGNPYNLCQRIIPAVAENPQAPVVNQITKLPSECDFCGVNALCRGNTCICKEGLRGNPYIECRPECVTNTECPENKACIVNKCQNPCLGEICGINAVCTVRNHFAVCTCPDQLAGNALVQCDIPKSK